MELRHGGNAQYQIDRWFKMAVLRGRFRPDCLKIMGSEGMDTSLIPERACLDRVYIRLAKMGGLSRGSSHTS